MKSKASSIYPPDTLKGLPDLAIGQCCSLKLKTDTLRVWLCRVAGGVTIERYNGRRWEEVAGNCYDTGEEG